MTIKKNIYSKVFRVSFLTCFFLVVCSLITFAFEEKLNFSGDWVLNKEKSTLGEGRFRMAAEKLKVAQAANEISIERTSNRPSGETVTTVEKITLDGKESENTTFQGSKKKSIAAWSSDGKTLTITSNSTFVRDGNEMKVSSVEVWTLASDGSLAINFTSSSPRGETKNSLVYNQTK